MANESNPNESGPPAEKNDVVANGPTDPLPPSSDWTLESALSTLTHPPTPSQPSPVPFFHLLNRLKTTKREGWRRFGINTGESISDHMYRMALITMLAPTSLAPRLDLHRCTQLALVHDLAESLVGDITPADGIPKTEKSRRESETVEKYVCGQLLGAYDGGAQATQIGRLWREYEDNETLEACFVHDVDKMEMLLQAVEYEREFGGKVNLEEFMGAVRKIVLPEVKSWCGELLRGREAFWRDKDGERKGGEGLK